MTLLAKQLYKNKKNPSKSSQIPANDDINSDFHENNDKSFSRIIVIKAKYNEILTSAPSRIFQSKVL